MIVVSKFLVPNGYKGMTIWPFIFVNSQKHKEDIVVMNHEKIHLKQQLELLIIPFYILYFLDYMIGVAKYRNTRLAYKNIIFEKEAYMNQNNLDYLKERKFFSFIKYFNNH
jgi:hypothetical protein